MKRKLKVRALFNMDGPWEIYPELGFEKGKIYEAWENGWETGDFVIINKYNKHIYMNYDELIQNFKIEVIY